MPLSVESYFFRVLNFVKLGYDSHRPSGCLIWVQIISCIIMLILPDFSSLNFIFYLFISWWWLSWPPPNLNIGRVTRAEWIRVLLHSCSSLNMSHQNIYNKNQLVKNGHCQLRITSSSSVVLRTIIFFSLAMCKNVIRALAGLSPTKLI